MEIHSLLKRQLKNCNIDVANPQISSHNLNQLIELVTKSYMDFEEDKKLLERSIDISSREYAEQLEQIKSLQASLVANEKMAGIGQLSAGIAHEINNPLGFIQSNIETLSKYIEKIQALHDLGRSLLTLDNSNSDNQYDIIKKEVIAYSIKNKLDLIYEDLPNIIDESLAGIQRISTIVKSLLSFSRKGARDDFEDYDFNRGIRDTITISLNEIKYYSKVLENFEEIPLIQAKPGEINQVLLNIILNAVYAIKIKEIMGVIIIHTYMEGNYVCCEINDNGGGISQEYLSHIFEPFFTTKPIGTGTGLGLSISYDIIVNKHNGRIDVESEEGIGTTFTIYLPINTQNTTE